MKHVTIKEIDFRLPIPETGQTRCSKKLFPVLILPKCFQKAYQSLWNSKENTDKQKQVQAAPLSEIFGVRSILEFRIWVFFREVMHYIYIVYRSNTPAACGRIHHNQIRSYFCKKFIPVQVLFI